MRRVGLSHLTAVSGANFALVATFLFWFLQFVIKRLKNRLLIVGLILFLFIFLVRPTPSVLRAALMSAVILLAKYFGDRSLGIPSLAAAISVLILVDPIQSTDPGFALSVLATAGILLLSLTVPFVAVFLSGLSLAIYVFVYTPMKQTSNIAVMIGAIPGALPPLIGYTAVVGRIDEPGMMLFLVQFFWQFPHFWAIAWMLHDDYQKAGYWMLPTSGGRDKKGAYQIMIYTVLLIIVSMTPIYYGMSGPRALILILPISLWVLYKSYGLFKTLEVKEARKLLYATLIYTPVVFMAYILF
jgi:protoheme IX farnesyltransferase